MDRSQRHLLVVLTILVGLTRLFAHASSLFDWDEALFARGVRYYDVSDDRPHAPGYPLFVAAAKVANLVVHDDFRSLQLVVTAGAVSLFPALTVLGFELGFDFSTSILAALIFTFLPNVWVYGGTGFSDIPAIAFCLIGSCLVLRRAANNRLFILGIAIVGISCGIRPANILIAALPVAESLRRKSRVGRTQILAFTVGIAIILASYGGAALASSSPQAYWKVFRKQSTYVLNQDSFQNPGRPSLPRLAVDFLLEPVHQPVLMGIVDILAVVGLFSSYRRRRRSGALTLLMFMPVALFSWLMLDYGAAGRYSIAYLPAYALFAAEGLSSLFQGNLRTVIAAGLVGSMAIWTWPGLSEQRTVVAPPVAAFNWIKNNVPRSNVLYVNAKLAPQGAYLLPGRPQVHFNRLEEVPRNQDVWVIDVDYTRSGREFTISRNPLWDILRRRNFETSVYQIP